jgi:serine/threonine protein phosphatase PrpC
MGKNMHIEAVGRSEVGPVREHNEDAILVDDRIGLYVVCDGMGGHNAGEVASRMACESIQRFFSESTETLSRLGDNISGSAYDELAQLVTHAIQSASREIFDKAQANPEMAGMGTTTTLILMVGDKAIMGHVGDSRVYLQHSGDLHQISDDHTLIAQMIRQGKIKPENAGSVPFSNVITRAVGIQPSVEVDTLLFDFLPGDRMLLCSDGLCGFVDDPVLKEGLEKQDLDEAAESLVQLAVLGKTTDNISALVIEASATSEESAQARSQEHAEKFEALRRIPLFRHLDLQELHRVLNKMEHLEIPQGENIIVEGEQGKELYIILRGDVEVTKGNQVVRVMGPGDHFGEMALLNKKPRSATVRALNRVKMLALPRRGFRRLIRRYPDLSVKLLYMFAVELSLRLDATSEQLRDLQTDADETLLSGIPFLGEEGDA